MKRKRRKKKSTNIFSPVVIALCAVMVLMIAAGVYWFAIKPAPQPAQPPVAERPVLPPVVKPEAPPPVTEPAKEEKELAIIDPKPVRPTRQIAIIIDDIGYDLKVLSELIAIEENITFAVLPLLPHSRASAHMLREAGREIMLHLPMEPLSYPREKPGSGALFTDMNEAELIHQLKENFASVPYITGVNNHMGSRFMADEEKLTAVFNELRKRNLFFIDSRTTPESKVAGAAKKTRMPYASRTVFIDNERDYQAIYKILTEAARKAPDGRPIIMIGHPYPETIRALRDASKVYRQQGIEVVPVSRFVYGRAAQGQS